MVVAQEAFGVLEEREYVSMKLLIGEDFTFVASLKARDAQAALGEIAFDEIRLPEERDGGADDFVIFHESEPPK